MSAHSVEPLSPSDDPSPSPSCPPEASAAAGGLTKAWALPPRPKPGRKPATDTPPSKRKAQNREAQRAFRERRAARVGELEEELRQKQRAFDAEKQELSAGFEKQRLTLQQDIATWRVRSEHWERMAKEKDSEISQLRKQVEEASLQLRYTNTAPTFSTARKSWDQQLSPTSHQRLPILPLPVPHASGRQTEPSTPSADCRSCGQGGPCACIEKVLNSLPDPNMAASPPVSSSAATAEIKQEPDEMEIDFTAKFAAPSAPRWTTSEDSEPIVIDADETTSGRPPGGCGFCTDDSNCLCIQNSRNGPQSPYDMSNQYSNSNSTFSSPNTVPDTVPLRRPSTKSKPQPLEPASGPGGPGTCPSCVMDPERRRFCQALAAQSNPTTGSKRPAPSTRSTSLRGTPALPSIDAAAHLSCSQTYDLLREKLPDFAEKRNNAQFMQQLRTSPPDQDASNTPPKTSPYEVEAASVLSVLAHARGGSYSDGHNNVAKRRK